MDSWDSQADRHYRLVLQSTLGPNEQIPTSILEEVRERHGDLLAKDAQGRPLVQRLSWFRALPEEKSDWFGAVAVEAEPLREMFPELEVSPEAYEKFRSNDRTALVGVRLLERMRANGYAWGVGKRISFRSAFFGCNFENLEIVGVANMEHAWGEEQLLMHWSYLDRMIGHRNETRTIWVKARDAASVSVVMNKIHADYARSTHPVEAQTEREYTDSLRSMMGDVRGMVTLLGFLIAVTLLVVAANTMSITYRERTAEVAVLRTLGFSRLRVLFLFLLESVLITLCGALLALAFAAVLYNGMSYTPEPRIVPLLPVTWETCGLVLAMAGGLGIAAALLPGIRAVRQPIVKGIRFVG